MNTKFFSAEMACQSLPKLRGICTILSSTLRRNLVELFRKRKRAEWTSVNPIRGAAVHKSKADLAARINLFVIAYDEVIGSLFQNFISQGRLFVLTKVRRGHAI